MEVVLFFKTSTRNPVPPPLVQAPLLHKHGGAQKGNWEGTINTFVDLFHSYPPQGAMVRASTPTRVFSERISVLR